MSILIQKPGILSTVQDLGRPGYRRFGIGPGGVMDRTATRLINLLLGNAEGAAVLEMHFPAARLLFERPTVFAIGGAYLEPVLDGRPVDNWQAYRADAGSDLSFAGKSVGNRAYLAVRGGLLVDKWLGSASTNLAAAVGGYFGRRLAAGDRLDIGTTHESCDFVADTISAAFIPKYNASPEIRITAGAEYGLLTEESKAVLRSSNFVLGSNSSRMACRLAGPTISTFKPIEMLSSAVAFGTVQLLPDGQLAVLMADHQTTGGYPRIAHAAERDLALLAQLAGGDQVSFQLIGPAETELLNAEFEHEMALFGSACRIGSGKQDPNNNEFN